MLTIRPKQLQTLTDALQHLFVKRLIEMLRSEHPESREVPRDEMEETVRLLLTKAESYGLETEEQIGTYVMVAWIMGPDFDTKYPAAVDVLPATHFSAEEKSEWLVEWSDRIISALKSP